MMGKMGAGGAGSWLRWAMVVAVVVAWFGEWREPLPLGPEVSLAQAAGFTTSATATPSPVAPGVTVALGVGVTSANATAVLVDLEIWDPSNTKIYQEFFDNQSFTAGQNRTYPTTWDVPAGAATGNYSVKVGIFSPGWAANLAWNGSAATIAVSNAAPTATGTPAGPQPTPTPAGGVLPPLPTGWPTTFELGLMDSPGGAAALKQSGPFGFRYQYLAGGVNTGQGWATWNSNGSFVTTYITESAQAGIRPVFSYYMIRQSAPGKDNADEYQAVTGNLANVSTMHAFWADLKLFFQRAGSLPNTRTVLHVEPDMWGYMQRRATGDNAATVPVQVAGSGFAELAGLPDNASGFARAVIKLRDTYAPNVILGYHLSVWGTGTDIYSSNSANATVDTLGQRAANFYLSLGANFDLAFGEFSDRDAGFYQYIYGDGGASWFDAADFGRGARFFGKFVAATGKRLVIWQIPLGNTRMRAMDNTWGHYQDNRPEWFLDDATRQHLNAYVQAGAVAFLFGGGADGTTCACDGRGDGVTNPNPINGNTATSLTADDDGGFFKQKANAYYTAGALPLSGAGGPPPAVTPTATTIAAGPTATATTGPIATPVPPTQPGNLKLIQPVRVVDTRSAAASGNPAAPIGYAPGGGRITSAPLNAGETRRFLVAGQTFGATAIPADANGLLVNVTIVQGGPSGGYVTVFPGNLSAPPTASTVNPASAVSANFTAVALPTSGQFAGTVAVYSTNQLDVLLDVVGYYAPSNPAGAPAGPGNLQFVNPVRIVDTRSAAASGNPAAPIGFNADGTNIAATPLTPGQSRRFLVAGRSFGGTALPANLSGVLVHITTVQGGPSGGFVSCLPGDFTGTPGVSTVNPATAIAFNAWASAVAGSGTAAPGTIAIYSTNQLDVVVDLLGYWSPTNPNTLGSLSLFSPVRVLDTRSAASSGNPAAPVGFNPDGSNITAAQLAGTQSRRFLIGGKSFAGTAIPADVKAILANVTTVQGGGTGGFVTLYPGDSASVPNVSTVNPVTSVAASFWANGIPVAPTVNAGQFALYATHPLDVVVDVVGYYR